MLLLKDYKCKFKDKSSQILSAIYIIFLVFLFAFIIINVSSVTISIYSIYFSKPINIEAYIKSKMPVTVEFIRYCIEKYPTTLFKKYRKLTPNLNPVEYHTILPFHEDGTSKREINYLDYFNDDNLVIKHFSFYLNHSDKFEKSTKTSQILNYNENSKENDKLKKELELKNFTLIYLIVVSSPKSNIIREMKAFENESNDEIAFILFIDNKSNRTKIYELFRTKFQFKNIYFIDSPRFHVGWSKITLSLSEAVLIKAAVKYFSNSLYLSLHSESDYPLIPSNFILKYLKLNYPNNFIALNNLSQIAEWKLNRPNIFHLNSKINPNYMKMIHHLFPKRAFPPIVWQFGSNWFTLTLKDSKKLIDKLINNPIFVDFLEYSFISDENIFQTLLVEANITTTNNNHRYIDWNTNDGHPRTFDVTNFNGLIKNKCNFWARKFSAKNQDILDMIDTHIHKIKKLNNSKFILNCK